jgi:hypothetical protein
VEAWGWGAWISHSFHCKLVLTYGQGLRRFRWCDCVRDGARGWGRRLRGGWSQVVSFCLGWKERWVRLVNRSWGFLNGRRSGWPPGYRVAGAGGGDYAAG